MTETIVVTQEEVQQIKDLQTAFVTLGRQYGDLAFQIHALTKARETIEANLAQIEEVRTKVTTELQQKYGPGSVNLETGEFTPQPAA